MKPSPTSDWLILNYGQALDVAFQDNWEIVEKNLPTFKTKLLQSEKTLFATFFLGTNCSN